MASNNAINQHKPIPMFFAYLAASTGAVTGDGTAVNPVPFDTTLFNDGSYNTTTSLFFVPVDGIYLFNTNILTSNVDTKTDYNLSFDPGGYSLIVYSCNPATVTVGGNFSGEATVIMELAATMSMQVGLTITGGAKNCAIISGGANAPQSWFSATLIG